MLKTVSRILGGFETLSDASYPFKALITFIKNPRLIKYIAIPIIVNIIVAIALYSGLLFFGLQIRPLAKVAIANYFALGQSS